MSFSRRTTLTGLSATLAAALTGCSAAHVRLGPPPKLDTKRLDRDFPALAERGRPGDFAVGVLNMGTSQTWCWNAEKHYPLQWAAVLPLAATVLGEVDAGKLALAQRVTMTAMDLSPPSSAINAHWPSPPEPYGGSIPLANLLALAVQAGDTTAADVLMKAVGGPGAVTAWLEAGGVTDMRVDRYQRERIVEMAALLSFHPDWKDPAGFVAARGAAPVADRQKAMEAALVDPRDAATLPATLNLLLKLAAGNVLSKTSTQLLTTLLTGTRRGAARLKAGLPKDAALAHVTGADDTDMGFTPAVADVGIVTLADGRRLAIAAFLAGSTGTQAQRDGLFADAARLIVAAAG